MLEIARSTCPQRPLEVTFLTYHYSLMVNNIVHYNNSYVICMSGTKCSLSTKWKHSSNHLFLELHLITTIIPWCRKMTFEFLFSLNSSMFFSLKMQFFFFALEICIIQNRERVGRWSKLKQKFNFRYWLQKCELWENEYLLSSSPSGWIQKESSWRC